MSEPKSVSIPKQPWLGWSDRQTIVYQVSPAITTFPPSHVHQHFDSFCDKGSSDDPDPGTDGFGDPYQQHRCYTKLVIG